jgi:alkylation response protein AidB-like acyl-CoA dehydrogenase
MTITDITDIDSRHDLLDRAAAVGRDIAGHADGHDRDGTFVTEAFEQLRDSGLLAMAVPTELGGAGATIRQVAAVQQELGRHDGSAVVVRATPQHLVASTTWRYRRGMPGAEATLRRVADDGIVVLSTGGGDFSRPRGTAVRVDGGFRVSGTKPFVSQAPVGAVLSTMFVLDDPERGRRVLNMAVPVASDGVAVLDDWDALGMRGTGSHSVAFHDVFVPDERVLADRPYGVIDGPLQVIVSIAMPIISAAYLGVAQAAYEAAVRAAVAGADDPLVQRQVGLMAHRLQVAQWSLDGALDEIGDDPTPSLQGLGAALAAKREVALAGVEVTDLAMEVAGGSAYFRGSPIERAYRDVRAAKFHPLTPELTLLNAGRTALGLPADEA